MYKYTADKNVNYKRVVRIAIPIAISNVTIPLLGVVDTGVIGQIGSAEPIAAVSLGAIVVSVCFWLFGFLRMGTTGLTALARGKHNEYEVAAILARGLLVGSAGGFVLILCSPVLIAFSLFFFQAAPAVEQLASDYLFIRIWSAPFSISMFALVGWLIAMERVKLVLFIQILINGFNILFDLYFVLVLDLGVVGVAFASLISEICGFLMAIFFCRSVFKDKSSALLQRVFSLHEWQRMFQVNLNIFLRSAMLEIVVVSYVFFGSTFGTVLLAANQVLFHFMNITAYLLDGLAFSAEVLVGIAVGNRSVSSIRETLRRVMILSFLVAIFLSIFFLTLGPHIIGIMVLDQSVQAEANVYLFWMVVTPLSGFTAWMLDGVFVGSTKTEFMRKAMTQSFIFYFSAILIFYPIFGNHGLWLSINLMFLARAFFLIRYYPFVEQV